MLHNVLLAFMPMHVQSLKLLALWIEINSQFGTHARILRAKLDGFFFIIIESKGQER